MGPDNDSEPNDRKRKQEAESIFEEVRVFKRARSEPVQLIELTPAVQATVDATEAARATRPTIVTPPSNAPLSEQHRTINPEAMALVKKQLCQLSLQNRGMKASMQEMREAVVGDLMSIMKTRRIVIEQLGRPDLAEDIREPCKDLLAKRKLHMVTKEEELLSLEKLLTGHEAVLEHADWACMELEEKIRAFEKDQYWDPTYTMKDFPQMSALARLTGGGSTFSNPVLLMNGNIAQLKETQPVFTKFMNLPLEVRLQIWEACLPGPRVITYSSRHNRTLTLLAVCEESRRLLNRRYIRVLSPGAFFPLIATSYLYVDPEIDTVVRELTLPSDEVGSLFDLNGPQFNLRCFALLSGLAKVKHLAIGFDLLNENGGRLFSILQACCPQLETLTLFLSSQLRGLRHPRDNPPQLRFLDFDSNFVDYMGFRWDRCRDKILKHKAIRGLSTIQTLSEHALQYMNVFSRYVDQFGQEWKPTLKIGLLMKWNSTCQGWQTRYIDTDRYSRGFPGEDGKLYRGFIESGMICDAEGEIMSRYDGIRHLFEEI